MSVDAPLTRRRRPISVSESRTAPSEWLDEETLLLAAGVTLTLPSTYGQVTIKALGAGCSITSARGIEDSADPSQTVTTRALAIGDALTLAADSGTSWSVIMAYFSAATIAAIGSAGTLSTMQSYGYAKVNTTDLTATGAVAGAGDTFIDSTSAAVDAQLPAATGSGKEYTIHFRAGTNAAKVAPASGEKLGDDYATNAKYTLAAIGDSVTFIDAASGKWAGK